MQRELHGSPERPGALEYRASSDSLVLEFELTKRKAHAAVGYCEGVCTATDLARQLGLQGVWVPASPAIHSNRRAIHEELVRRGWTLRGGKEHPFSTEPFRYTFSQVLEAPERYPWSIEPPG